MDKDIVISAKDFLSRNWGVDEIAEIKVDTGDQGYEALLDKVTWVIDYLIEKDMERLFWMLYRIDVSEKKVRDTLVLGGPDNAARSLAELVVEREIQKAITRASFKQATPDISLDNDEERW